MSSSLRFINNNIDNFNKEVINYKTYNYDKTKTIEDIVSLMSNQTLNNYNDLLRELNSTVYGSQINGVNGLYRLLQMYKTVLIQLENKNLIQLDSTGSYYVLKQLNSKLGIKYLGYLLSVVITLNIYISLLNEYFDLYQGYEKNVLTAITSFFSSYNKTDEEINEEFFNKILPSGEFDFTIKLNSGNKLILPIVRIGKYCSLRLNETNTLFFILTQITDGKKPIIYEDCDPGIYNFTRHKYNFYQLGFDFTIVINESGLDSLNLSTTQDVIRYIENIHNKVFIIRPNKKIIFTIKYYGCKEPRTGYITFTRRQFLIRVNEVDLVIQLNDPNINSIKSYSIRF